MDWDTVISILKWIGLVFLAGLIGYFGKFLGKRIISRFWEKKENAKSKEISPVQPSIPNEKPDYKLEKKRLKQEQKRIKKQEKTKKSG
ncbi:MAG: hypothetical protein PVH61_38190 [Candidatus Aminicenantes bacterium]|jgi:hypothetical protein